ncbi:thioredoxin [Nitzschia inconspicua]|uniref:Thioredoxin n=1 Tax=Nitzschia inconspicua TaxID=303405 RepID=A0A9K3KT33_9STRA|nr:thioredoxin [Nitzschia inconspicua]
MLCCIGGVCVPYTAVVPLVLLAFRWCLAKLALYGLVPESIVKMMNLQEIQSSCCSNTNKEEVTTKKSCCTTTGPSAVVELKSEEEFNNLLEKGGKIVVKFTASWCKPCKNIQPFYDQLSAQYKDSASFLTVDVDDFDALSSKYKVAMMPTFLVVHKDQVLGTYRGSAEPQLETFLKEQLA